MAQSKMRTAWELPSCPSPPHPHTVSMPAPTQAAARAAEQQASSLEAALQSANQVTMSLTDKVAKAMSDAGGQVEVIKVGRVRPLVRPVGRAEYVCLGGGGQRRLKALPWHSQALLDNSQH